MQLSQTQIKNGWKVVKLGEVATLSYGKSLPERDRIAGDFPVYASAGKVGTHNSFLTKAPAIVVGRKGNVGVTYFVKENFYTIDTAYFIEENKNYNLKYLYYQLGILHLKELNTDSAVPGLNREVAYAQLINLPPLPTQEKIAGVLGTYDDLIENNDKRIKTLEAMAQKLYTEWFVNFKFPGYEKVKMVASGHPDFGMVPEGWEVRSLSEITSVITKGTTPTTIGKSFCEYGINYIKIETIGSHGEILNDKFTFIDQETHELLKRSKLEEFDILFSIAGAIGRTILVNKSVLPSNTNQALAIIRLIDLNYVYYIYQIVSSKLFLNFSTERIVQTAQANLSLAVIGSARLLVPNTQIIFLYNEIIKPLFSKIENLKNMNQNLKKSRDFLIPQLVGGRVEVKN